MGKDIKFTDVLLTWEGSLESYAADDPDLEARVRITLGDTYLGLGLYSQALAHFQRARDLREGILDREHPDYLEAVDRVARVLRRTGEAERALVMLQQVAAIQARTLPPDHPKRLFTDIGLAATHLELARFDEALALSRHAYDLLSPNPEAHPLLTYDAAEILAAVYARMGKLEPAAELQETGIRAQRQLFGPGHARVLLTMQNLAGTRIRQRRFRDAGDLYGKISEQRARLLGENHPYTLSSRHGLVVALNGLEQWADAWVMARDVLERQTEVLGDDHPQTLSTRATLAIIAGSVEHYEECFKIFKSLLDTYERKGWTGQKPYLRALNNYGHFLSKAGRADDAETVLKKALDLKTRQYGPQDLTTIMTQITLGQVLLKAARLEKAEKWFVEAASLLRASHPNRKNRLAECLTGYGICLLKMNRPGEAEAPLLEALTLVDPASSEAGEIRRNLVQVYTTLNMPDKAELYRDETKPNE